MRKVTVTPSGVGRLPLLVALAALFVWASVWHAQTEQGTYESSENGWPSNLTAPVVKGL